MRLRLGGLGCRNEGFRSKQLPWALEIRVLRALAHGTYEVLDVTWVVLLYIRVPFGVLFFSGCRTVLEAQEGALDLENYPHDFTNTK